MKIPITKPDFGEEERRLVVEPLASGWVVQGPFVAEFERKFADFTRAGAAVATTSCTTALHIAVAALGLKSGDEVIVPAFTWVSTANVVEYMGAKPVFCDIDPGTFNIDVDRIEGLITERTVGLIPVHLFGLCAEMDPILELAAEHDLWVVEDAACALGSWYKGRHAGTFGDMGCFSFHPRKSITTGEGGMITVDNPELEALSRSLRDHGASRTDLERHEGRAGYLLADYDLLGYNFRMTDIQGALGCAQMDRAPALLAARREKAARYDELLSGFDWLIPPVTPADHIHGYQAYTCMFAPEKPSLGNVEALNSKRNQVMSEVETAGVATRQGTHAAALQGYYRKKYGLSPEDFPNAYLADRLSLALPLFPGLTESEQDFVVDVLRQAGERLL